MPRWDDLLARAARTAAALERAGGELRPVGVAVRVATEIARELRPAPRAVLVPPPGPVPGARPAVLPPGAREVIDAAGRVIRRG